MARPVGEPWDAVVVGGGPVGTALSLLLDRGGLRVLLLDAGAASRKVCGEGLLPQAWGILEGLGVTAEIPRAGPISGISYRLYDPRTARVRELQAPLSEAAFGVERALLSQAFEAALGRSGVELLRPAKFRELRFVGDALEVGYQKGGQAGQSRWLATRYLFGADGLSSSVRRASGLEGGPPDGQGRWGARAYFAEPPGFSFEGVQVRLGRGLECYRTPLGGGRSGLAFLWSPSRLGRPLPGCGGLYARLLQALPEALRAELPGELEGDQRAVGPLRREVRSVLHPGGRVALLGDAAGYLDAVTGQGMCLGLAQAETLAGLLGSVRESRSGLGALANYPAAVRALRFRHLVAVYGLLFLMDRPELRLRVLRALAEAPELFGALLAVAVEEAPLRRLFRPDLLAFLRALAFPPR